MSDIVYAGGEEAGLLEWSEGVSSGYVVQSSDVYGKDHKDALLGVPFVITEVVYQEPIKSDTAPGGFRDYVSLTARIAPRTVVEDRIRRGRVPGVNSISDLAVRPNEGVVINDGSTGIRRQITQLLDGVHLIRVGEHPDLPGDKRYDLSFVKWEDTGSQMRIREVGMALPTINRNPNGEPLRIICHAGLRVSDYTNDYGDGQTYYLG